MIDQADYRPDRQARYAGQRGRQPAGEMAVRDPKRLKVTERLIRLTEVVGITGLSAGRIAVLIAAGEFPPTYMVGRYAKRWKFTEVSAWAEGHRHETAKAYARPTARAPRRRAVSEALLVRQAPEHNGRFRSVESLFQDVVRVSDMAHSQPGIYFLWRGDVVVYVGQTRSGYARIATHLCDPSKNFDGISFIKCTTDQLDVVERTYIDALLPEHNGDSITAKARRARDAARSRSD